MTPSFELALPGRILFGAGRLAEVPDALAALGLARIFLVTGRDSSRATPLSEALEAHGLAAVPFRVPGEPTVELAREGVALARAERCDGVLSFGGGSALDCGKAVAGLAATGADPLDHLEVIGRGQPLTGPTLPFVAIPTTAGTGAEVTRNAVLGSKEHGVKASLRSPRMLARLAVVDPDLLIGLPPAVLAASGLDALTQNLEPYLSARANPFTDGLAAEGMRRSARSLRRAFGGELDAVAREDLALASLFGGLCLANGGLGAVHGFAAPVGGRFEAPHGAVCAALLAPALGVNLRALRARAPGHPTVGRYADVARWLTGRDGASAEEGIGFLADLVRDLGVPGLASYGARAADAPLLAERARAASSMKANPIALTEAELTEIVVRAL